MNVPRITYDVKKKIWITLYDFSHEVDEYYTITIPKGFEFNLASVPRFLWVLIPPFELSISAPLVHDYLYRNKGKTDQRSYIRAEADRMFETLMEREGVVLWKRKAAYLAVRVFGWVTWYQVFNR